jgi:hypothetical protein|tara:strand:+ start:4444 stop:4767 length:324 start_codon:yes stop_codon:yes gene_type:complete
MSDLFEAQQEALAARVEKVAERSGSKIAKRVAKKDDNAKDRSKIDRLMHMLVDEGLNQFFGGDVKWLPMIEDLAKAMKEVEASRSESRIDTEDDDDVVTVKEIGVLQ